MDPTAIAENIYQVHIPIPFPLVSVNCYLVREDNGWTMIDTGLHHRPAFEAWEHAFRKLQMTARDLRRIILTHAHPDHYGLAGYFQEISGAPVLALDKEAEIVPILWRDEGGRMTTLDHFFHKHGAPPDVLETITHRSREVLEMLQPQPVLSSVREGEQICVGGEPYNIHWVPGHSDGHLLLHRVRDGLLFIGDQVLLKITPNIGLWPLLDPNPLQSYLKSLERLTALDVNLALPGHRGLIHDLPGRIAEIKYHHGLRLQACIHAAGDGATGYEVCLHIFPRLLNADDIRMGMVEALSHLEYLASQERLERLDGEVIRYRRKAAPSD